MPNIVEKYCLQDLAVALNIAKLVQGHYLRFKLRHYDLISNYSSSSWRVGIDIYKACAASILSIVVAVGVLTFINAGPWIYLGPSMVITLLTFRVACSQITENVGAVVGSWCRPFKVYIHTYTLIKHKIF